MTEHARGGFERVQYDALDRRIMHVEGTTQALTSLVNSLAQSHALFEYKTDQARRVSEKLETLVEKISDQRDAQRTVVEQMLDDHEERLKEALAAAKAILLLEIDNRTKPYAALETKVTKLETDVSTLQKFMWIAMGGAAVISFILEKLFSLLG